MDDALIALLRRTLEIRAEDVDDDIDDDRSDGLTGERSPELPGRGPARIMATAGRHPVSGPTCGDPDDDPDHEMTGEAYDEALATCSRGRRARRPRPGDVAPATSLAGSPVARNAVTPGRRGVRWGGAAVAVALVGVGLGGVLAVDRAGHHTGSPAAGSAATPGAAMDAVGAVTDARPVGPAPAASPAPTAADPADDVAWVLPVRLPPEWQLTEISAVVLDSTDARPVTTGRHFIRALADGETVAELIAGVQPVWPSTDPLTITTTVRGLDAEVYVEPAEQTRRGMLPLTTVRWFDDGLEAMVFGYGLSTDEVLAVAERAVLHDGTLTIDPEGAGLGGFANVITLDGFIAIGVDGVSQAEPTDDHARPDTGGDDDDADAPTTPTTTHTVWLTARSATGTSASPIVITASPASGDLDDLVGEQESPVSYRRTVDGVDYFVRPAADEDIGPHTFLMWIADGVVYSWSGPFEASVALQFAAMRPASRSEAAIAATEIAERTMELPVRATARFVGAGGLAADVRGTAGTAGPVALCVAADPPRCLQPTTDGSAGGRGETAIAGVFSVDSRRLLVGWVADDPGVLRASDGTPVEVVASDDPSSPEGWFLLAELGFDADVPRLVSGDGSSAYTVFALDDDIRP